MDKFPDDFHPKKMMDLDGATARLRKLIYTHVKMDALDRSTNVDVINFTDEAIGCVMAEMMSDFGYECSLGEAVHDYQGSFRHLYIKW